MKPVFRGKIEEGKLVLDRNDLFKRAIHVFEGERVVVTVTKQFNKRSLPQNAYYWGVVLPTISEDTGHTVMELHDIFKGMFLPKRAVKFKDKVYHLMGSTTKLSVGGFVEYIERINAEAGSLGIVIPTPEEAGFISNK
jgi:hypothetical protein|tara:strand:- start:1469 stop:1882 length:414 start_codon:yes stop_codon:yes gene_type:complete